MNNAALPGSDGHKEILAKRAAELDGCRKLTERTLGVQVTSNTTIKNFAVASDEIKAAPAAAGGESAAPAVITTIEVQAVIDIALKGE